MTPELELSNQTKGRILVVDDEADLRESLHALLTIEGGYRVDLAENGAEGLRKMETRLYDLVLLDLMMPDRSGMDVLREVRERDRETPIFILTAYGTVERAVEALKLGANDFFNKPWGENQKLLIEIERAISGRRLEYENTHLKRALKQRYAFPNIVGKSERMLRLLDLVAQVAPTRSTVLITGETGTGKELIAKAIHTHSPRAENMFVPVNSGSLSPELLESTLFGHVRGRLHQRHRQQEGLLRGGRQGHHLLRRDRQHRLRYADQAAARHPGARIHRRRLQRPHQGGRPHHRRHQRGPSQAGGGGPVPRGPLLSPGRHQRRAAAAPRAQGRHPGADLALFQQVLPRERQIPGRAGPLPCCASCPRPCRS